MGVCQIIFTAWLFLALGVSLAQHGQPRTGKNNFWIGLVSAALQFILLYFGGFYG